jgi:hypothetical protein
MNGKRLLIINCYFPTDKKNQNDNCPELDDCLAEISNIIQTTNFTDLRILGDLNYETGRQTSHAKIINTFIMNNNLNTTWDFHAIDFTYMFESENGQSKRSTIDHFIGLRRQNERIVEAGVIHRVENSSDHEVIYCIIQLKFQVTADEKISSSQEIPKLSWKKATEDQKLEYNDVLFRNLMSIESPECISNCRDLNCKDESHISQIDAHLTKVLELISISGDETIPRNKPAKTCDKGCPNK